MLFKYLMKINHLQTHIMIFWVMILYGPIGWFTNILKEGAASFFMLQNVIHFRFVSL